MTSWIVISVLAALGLLGVGIYNIRSLVRKWKHNPGSWLDLLFGILIWLAALGAMGVILFRYISEQLS